MQKYIKFIIFVLGVFALSACTNRSATDQDIHGNSLKTNESRSLIIFVYSDADEAGNSSSATPKLVVKGVSVNQTLGHTDLSIHIDIDRPLSEKYSIFDISDVNGSNLLLVSDIFSFDVATNTFTADAHALNAVLNKYSLGMYYLSINLVSEDMGFAESYSFMFRIDR